MTSKKPTDILSVVLHVLNLLAELSLWDLDIVLLSSVGSDQVEEIILNVQLDALLASISHKFEWLNTRIGTLDG